MDRSLWIFCCSMPLFAACGESHSPSFDPPIDHARDVRSLSQAELDTFCESARDLTEAERDRLWPSGCKAIASYAADCRATYDECLALAPEVTYTCASSRVLPAEQPLCASITVGEAAAGIEAWAGVEIPETIDEICALPAAERAGIGDLGRLGVGEPDIDGYNCAVNSTLTPVPRASGDTCWELTFGTLCL